MTDISLKPFQEPHFNKILEILKHWYVYVDHSNTGSGKTVVTTAVARAMGLDILLIAPPILHKQWIDTTKKYGVRVIMSLSYQKLRAGKSSSKADRCILVKSDTVPDKYETTMEFTKLLKHGILLVFDEFHNVKNASTMQLESSHTLVRALVQTRDTVSRCALLSATPGDRAEHAPSMLKMLGICTHSDLIPHGINEIIKFSELIDPIITVALTDDLPQDTSKIKQRQAMMLAYEAYREIFGPYFTSCAMPSSSSSCTATTTQQHLRLNGFFKLPPDDEDLLRKSYQSLVSALSYNETDNSIKMDKTKLALVTKCMGTMEACKVRTIARLATNELNDSNRKVIIYFNFKEPMTTCARLLSEFRPAILNGDTSQADRTRIIDSFQKPSNDMRVIITHPSVGGVGVCLDDTDGNFPRTQFLSPSYFFIGTCQAMGRVSRSSTMSSSKSFLVFCKNVSAENRLLTSMSRKADTVRAYRSSEDGGNNDALLYPGEYSEYVEP